MQKRVIRRGVTRRDVLRGAGGLVAAPFFSACGRSETPAGAVDPVGRQPSPDLPNPFVHGVASGDPLSDRVILWTRTTPPAAMTVPIIWQMAVDPDFVDVVAQGELTTDATRDYTAKVDVPGLASDTTYFYRFLALGHASPVGRTRTLPVGSPERMRFALASCSQYSNGFFNVYGRIAERADLNAVIHLGDYIYEGGGAAVRAHEPPVEIVTLEDYRTRYAQYRLDPDLAEVHRQHPFITIWDDHESTNNSYRDGASNHTEGPEGVWSERKAISQQVYFEWLPIRETVPGDFDRIYRSFTAGDLLQLTMLDTRLQRDQPPADFPPLCEPSLTDPDRDMLGNDQEAWFIDQLRSTDTTWRLVGTSVMFGQWKVFGAPNDGTCGGQYLNADQWDGYQVARDRIFDVLRGDGDNEPATNVVFLTGDIHSAWALDVVDDPNNPLVYNPVTGDGSLAVEFIVDSVTSSFPIDGGDDTFVNQNLHVKYIETDLRGYLVLDVTPARVQGEWHYVDTVAQPSTNESFGAAWQCVAGAMRMTEGDGPTEPPADPPPLAP